MASTIQSPPPGPPMRPPRAPRSLAGPFVLIAVGIFFLLSNLGIIQWHDFGYWFSHYWPLLLILWGVIKLIEHQHATSRGMRAPGIGAGGVILVVFLVIAGLSATGAYENWDRFRDAMHMDNDVPWWGHTYSYTDDMQQAFPAAGGLHVNNERGAINISASEDSQLHVTVHKRVNAERQSDADKWDKSTRPQISTSGQVVTINANTQGSGDHWVSTDLDIAVPRKVPVVVAARKGDVSIMGRDATADVRSKDGDVSVTDLNGALTLNLDGSSAHISQVSSDVTIQGSASDISLEDIKGSVRLDGDFKESVKLSRIAKPVSFKSSRTDIDFTRLDGYLNLDSGDLEATSVSGPLRLQTRYKDIMLNGVTSDVHLQNDNGAVEIHLNKVGSLEITNSKGDIRVFVPAKAGFQVDAQARDGEIQTDFNSLKVTNGDDRSTASGVVNGGGPRMVLNNEHGTIEIREGSVVSQASPNPPKPPGTPEPTEN